MREKLIPIQLNLFPINTFDNFFHRILYFIDNPCNLNFPIIKSEIIPHLPDLPAYDGRQAVENHGFKISLVHPSPPTFQEITEVMRMDLKAKPAVEEAPDLSRNLTFNEQDGLGR